MVHKIKDWKSDIILNCRIWKFSIRYDFELNRKCSHETFLNVQSTEHRST